MALRGRRINNFIRLWCLVASGGLYICVLSISFQKNDIGWPQQPPTEKVQKFNMIFYDSNPKKIFLNIKIKLNLNASMTLKSSVVVFQALKLLQPQWPHQPHQPQWPQWPQQPHFIKKILILMIWSSLAPKWPIPVPFCWMDHQKSNFSLISYTLSDVGGCWGQLMFFFKLVDETQISAPSEYTRHHNSRKLLVLLSLRAI